MSNGQAERPTWGQFLDEVETVSAEMRDAGWDVLVVVPGHATAVGSETGKLDRHGFVYVVSGETGDQFADAFVPGGYSRADVYGAAADTRRFLLTVAMDGPSETAILLAGAFEHESMRVCRRAAEETETMYSHVFAVDGSHLGSIEHEAYDIFFEGIG